MQQLTLQIPDHKLTFFMELIQSLGFVQVDKKTDKSILSEHQKELINLERNKAKDDPDYMQDWEQARKTLNLD